MSVRLVLRLVFALGTVVPAAQAAETVYLVGTTSSRDCVPQFATIQAAIDAASGNVEDTTTIRIQGNETYLEDLDISSKHVRLVGTSSCQFVGAFVRPVISGAGGAARSIVNINGEARRIGFEKLVLQRGDELQNNVSYGGAIDISGGAHSVELTEVQIDHSEAGLGGAISVRGPAQPGTSAQTAQLYLNQDVTISDNTVAFSGGGLYCRNAYVFVRGTGTALFRNTAGSYGGGVYLDNCVANIAAVGPGNAPVLWLNQAAGPGGGLAAFNDKTRVAFGNLAPDRPTRIGYNHSDRFGGGIDLENGAQVTIFDGIVEYNTARLGGGGVALYVEDQETRFTATSMFDEQAGRMRCSGSVECNLFRNNEAYDGATPRPGAAIRASRAEDEGITRTQLLGTRLTAHRGATLFQFVDDVFPGSSSLEVNGAVIDRNETTDKLFDGSHFRATSRFSAVTVADNVIGATAVFDGGNLAFSLRRSIVNQPGKKLAAFGADAGAVQYVLANAGGLLGLPSETGPGGGPINIEGSPFFVDAANANYQLRRNWDQDVDFAPHDANTLTRDRGNRLVDTTFADRFGPQDLGAFETPFGAPILYGFALQDAYVGLAYPAFTVPGNGGGGRIAYSASGLPAGLRLDLDAAVLSGTPAAGTEGSYNVTFTATNGLGETGSITVPLVVRPNPATADGECGPAHQLERFDAPTFDLCRVGTPTEVLGTGPWTWTCVSAGSGTTASCEAAPSQDIVLTAMVFPVGTVGSEYQFLVTAESFYQPVTFSASGMPPGLSIDPVTGGVRGFPTTAGNYPNVQISASNPFNSDTKVVQLVVYPSQDSLFSDGFEDRSNERIASWRGVKQAMQ